MAIARGLHPLEKVREYQSKGWWSDETVDQLYLSQVEARGEELALVDPANRTSLLGTAPRRLSWAELHDEVLALAARLDELGLQRGDVVGVQLPNTIELVEVYLASWLLGIVVSPLPMQYREHEVLEMANLAHVDTFIGCPSFGSRDCVADVAAVRDQIASLRHLVAFDRASGAAPAPGVIAWEPRPATALERERVIERHRTDPNDPNDCVTICWTSGTESTPKGVMRTHLDWIAMSWTTVDGPQVTTDDVICNPFPMVNMAGINAMLLPWLRTGCVLVQHHPFDLATFVDQIARERVTYTSAPPAVLWDLLRDDDLMATADLSSLRRMGSGSAPLQPTMVKGWQERHGIGIINMFGSNEGVALIASTEDFPDPTDRSQFFPRYGHPGRTWAARISEFIQLRLVDQSTGEPIVEPQRPGELRIAGPTVFPRYLDSAAAAAAFDADGFFKTGDLFEIAGRDDHFLRYVGRAKDLIIRGGMNIAPAELESLIGDHPAVAEVAVIGDPHERLGETVAAVVVPRPGRSLELSQIVEFLRGRKIASFKLPERLELRHELPRNPLGKVLKRELVRARAEAEISA